MRSEALWPREDADRKVSVIHPLSGAEVSRESRVNLPVDNCSSS